MLTLFFKIREADINFNGLHYIFFCCIKGTEWTGILIMLQEEADPAFCLYTTPNLQAKHCYIFYYFACKHSVKSPFFRFNSAFITFCNGVVLNDKILHQDASEMTVYG